MDEEERKEGLSSVTKYYELNILDIPNQAVKAQMLDGAKNVAGQIRHSKGNLVEEIAKRLLILACKDLGISEDRYRLTRGPIMVELVDTNYMRTRNLLEFDTCDYVHELELDNILVVDGKPIVDVESKAYADATMLKAVMLNASMVHQHYPDMGFVLLQLENALGGDYAEDEVKKGSGPAHVIMSQYPNIYLNIFTLLDGSRFSGKPIHESEYYKPMNIDKLRKVYFIIKGLVSERVKGDQVFSQKKVYVYNYNVPDKVTKKKSVSR